MVEYARQALDDRKTKAEAARDPGALFEAMEFLENLAALLRGNADAGVIDGDLQRLAVAAAADQHASARGIFDRVGNEVLQQPPQEGAVGFHRQRAGHEGQLQSLGARDRRKFDFERAHQIAHLEAGDRRRHRAGVEPRDVQERTEDFLDRLEGIVDIFDQARILAAVLAFDEARDIKPRRVQRLQNVVAGRGEEARLRDVGFIGLGLRTRQFLGPLADAAFAFGYVIHSILNKLRRRPRTDPPWLLWDFLRYNMASWGHR